FPGLIVQNEKHVGAWRMRAGNGLLPGVKGVVRSATDRMRGQAIERLLCDGAVDLAAIATLHGRALAEFDQSVAMLADLAAQGLVTIDGARIAITPDGRPYARLAANVFDAYRKPPPGAVSRAV
ncbi:MAG: coproporphyrinogen III oxidase, partial [Sphingomonas sanxanigenens]